MILKMKDDINKSELYINYSMLEIFHRLDFDFDFSWESFEQLIGRVS